jgi:hypothetical protein
MSLPLNGAAVAPDVDVVLLHGHDEHRARDRAPERRGVEVGDPGGGDVERAALDGADALGDELRAAFHQHAFSAPYCFALRGISS